MELHRVCTKTYNEAVLGDFLAHVDFCDEFVTELVCTFTFGELPVRFPIKRNIQTPGEVLH